MTQEYGILITATLAAAALSAVLSILAFSRRSTPGAAAYTALLVSATLWCITYAGELLSTSAQAIEWWTRLQFIGIVTVGPFWLLFSLAYAGKLRYTRQPTASVFFALPAITLVFALLGPRYGLVLGYGEQRLVHGVVMLELHHGPLFWLHGAYSYACIITGSVVLLTAVLREVKILSLQGVLIFIAAALPIAANVVTLLVNQPGFDLTPPSISVTGLLVAVGLLRYQMLSHFPGLVPVARNAVVESMSDGVIVMAPDGLILSANPKAHQLVGCRHSDLVGNTLDACLSGDGDVNRLISQVAEQGSEISVEQDLRTLDGRERHVEIVASPLKTGTRPTGQVLVMRDVTERKRLESELERRALHDELTGLPNRALLRAHLDELLALREKGGSKLALLFLDLDRFKEINETLGHEAGDRVLVAITARLRGGLQDSDLVARLGGDEFAVVLPDSSAEHALATAETLRAIVGVPLDLQSGTFHVGTSVGIALSPDDGSDLATLMQHADVALYAAKATPAKIARYHAIADINKPERLERLNAARKAVERREIEVYYQPVIDARDGQSRHFEALARWPQPDGSVASAAELIPLVAHGNMINKLTEVVLEKVLSQLAAWEADGWHTEVAINLSVENLRDETIVARLRDALATHGVKPCQLWAEITESDAMVDPQRSRAVLLRLRELGVRLSIDDFGVGQSSLSYVAGLPADELKIDRSFITDIEHEPDNQAIVRAAVTLGHDLCLVVTAEGVEHESDLQTVAALGCDQAQGYFIARPMPAADVVPWVRARSGARSVQ